MKTTWKVFLSIGVSVLIIGIIIFLIGLGLNGWNLSVKYEMHTFNSEEENTSLDLNLSAGTMDVVFYDGATVEVTYPDSVQYGYTVTENNGKITVAPKPHFSVWFGWNRIPPVTVKIPVGKVMDLSLDTSAGQFSVASGEFKSFKIDMSAGTVTVGDIKCDNFTGWLSAGTINVSGITCNNAEVKLSAGTSNINSLKCDNIKVRLSAGSANICVVGKQSDYSISVDKSAGSCNVSNQIGAVADKIIDVDLSAGSANFKFID